MIQVQREKKTVFALIVGLLLLPAVLALSVTPTKMTFSADDFDKCFKDAAERGVLITFTGDLSSFTTVTAKDRKIVRIHPGSTEVRFQCDRDHSAGQYFADVGNIVIRNPKTTIFDTALPDFFDPVPCIRGDDQAECRVFFQSQTALTLLPASKQFRPMPVGWVNFLAQMGSVKTVKVVAPIAGTIHPELAGRGQNGSLALDIPAAISVAFGEKGDFVSTEKTTEIHVGNSGGLYCDGGKANVFDARKPKRFAQLNCIIQKSKDKKVSTFIEFSNRARPAVVVTPSTPKFACTPDGCVSMQTRFTPQYNRRNELTGYAVLFEINGEPVLGPDTFVALTSLQNHLEQPAVATRSGNVKTT